MYDMIDQLIKRDNQAKESLNEVKRQRINSEQKIVAIKEQIRGEYLEKARANIKNIEKTEKLKAQKRLSEIESFYKASSEKVGKVYREKKNEWIELLFNRVLEV